MPVRTICIAVAEVIEGGTKQEFYADLRATLDLSRRVANLSTSECLKQDDLSLEKPPKIYTYPVVKDVATGVSKVISNITRETESQYKQGRWRMIRGMQSVRNYRSFPWPLLCNKSARMLLVSDQGEFLVAKIKLLSGCWTVRIASGSNYRDQNRTLRNNPNSIRDSKIWIDRKGKAILGIACELPISSMSRSKSGDMRVSSTRENFLSCQLSRSDVPFVITGDQCIGWQKEQDQRMQRLRQDRKSGSNRRYIRDVMDRLSEKNSRRMKDLCHSASAAVVRKAIQSNSSEIILDLTVKSYFSHFPWHMLSSMIKYKAESSGIKFTDATLTMSEPDVSKPHVYFKYSPSTKRIKIGMTGKEDGSRHNNNTDAPEELVILAIDNQPKNKLRAKEKHYHAMFANHRVIGEWFREDQILAWLREVRWIGNAGNLSQILQVLGATSDASSEGHLQAKRERPLHSTMSGCSQNAVSGEDISERTETALAVKDQLIYC